MTLAELAAELGCELRGDGTIPIRAIRGLEEAGPGDLTFLANPKYAPQLAATRASAVIVATDAAELPIATLRNANPYLCFARALAIFHQPPAAPAGIHPTAVVAASARIAEPTSIGAYAVVGPQVKIGAGTIIEAHAVIDGDTSLGRDNHIYPYASVGLPPQDLKYHGEATRLEIGDRNVVREFVTLNRGTGGGGGLTSIGSDNLFMAYAHVAHDCRVGNHTIFANAATLAGHVDVADHATIGAFSAVHQFCRVGVYGFLGGYTVATKDVLPYSKTVGNRARIYGVNTLGLQRRGFPAEVIAAIR